MTVIEQLIRERKEVIRDIFHSLPYVIRKRVVDKRENEQVVRRSQYTMRQEEIDLWHTGA